MPWSRLRINRPSDLRTRRHSIVDPSEPHQKGSLAASGLNGQDPQGNDESLCDEPNSSTNEMNMQSRPGSFAPVQQLRNEYLQEPMVRPQRFSLLKFRHASDSQLSRTAKEQADMPPLPMSNAPSIITTAPTLDANDITDKRKSTFALPRRHKIIEPFKSISRKSSRQSLSKVISEPNYDRAALNGHSKSAQASRVTFDEPGRLRALVAPPAYGDESNSSLALPVSRLSESSRSDASGAENGVYGTTTTTTHTFSTTTTTFFRLPRRKKNKGPLFPLPVKIPPSNSSIGSALTPRGDSSACPSESPTRQSPSHTPPLTALHQAFHAGHRSSELPSPLPSPSQSTLAPSSTLFASHDIPALHRDSTASTRSGRSSPVLAGPTHLSKRGRSSTKNSAKHGVDDEPLPTPPMPQSGRTSSSTTGRASLGGLFNLSRIRQSSEPHTRHGLPGTPVSTDSKSQSFSLSRDAPVVPERQEGDTPAKYLIRLEEAVSRGVVATILSKTVDEFSSNVLRSYMRGFKFFGDPLDFSIRKLLMESELPKETQQIDRVLQAFANRYDECNPGVYSSPDETYFIAFSLLILHTDVFNKNNKHKMQKQDYTKNAKGQGVADEILECFYDNISYTPFIHVEDDVDINGERIISHKPKKGIFPKSNSETLRKPSSRDPVDPYALILDNNNLDALRPTLRDVMNLEDTYNYLGTAPSLNLAELHRTFFKSGVLQIVSSRSRPEAFMSPETVANPAEAHPGVVDIKITKVGILWRKDMKKKKARSPWQEWGAILTGAQLYFFRNTSWAKSLMHQHDSHHKHAFAGPVTFKPPLENFTPDVLMSTEDAVALLDTSYKKHKNAFIFVRHGGLEETFLADNEHEMNDWLAKLNFASTFRTAGVRMRGVLGGGYEGERTRAMRRMDSSTSTHSSQTVTADPAPRGAHVDPELAHQIQIARRQIMTRKIEEAEEKLATATKQLDIHLRNARHLQILAPIQNKTREQVILAAGGMSAKIKWLRLEMWRTRCHKDILALDLEEEALSEEVRHPPKGAVSQSASTSKSHEPKKLGSRLGHTSQSPQITPKPDVVRPVTQPSPGKSFNLGDAFQTMQSPPQAGNHKPQGLWELPPLSFEQTRASLKSGSSLGATPSQRTLSHRSSVGSVQAFEKDAAISEIAVRLATPTDGVEDEEQEVLKEAGLVRPETPTPKPRHRETDETASDVEKGKTRDIFKLEGEFHDGRKMRRSLQRTLREAHVPSHHRSKKGRDSASSANMVDESGPQAETEVLTRGTGSFTVHGKKASVITFGSDWQKMSPEERMKSRKQSYADSAKLSVPSAIEDENSSATVEPARPVSSVSISTTTTRSGFGEDMKDELPRATGSNELQSEEASEEHPEEPLDVEQKSE